jgi:hypothetical protein
LLCRTLKEREYTEDEKIEGTVSPYLILRQVRRQVTNQRAGISDSLKHRNFHGNGNPPQPYSCEFSKRKPTPIPSARPDSDQVVSKPAISRVHQSYRRYGEGNAKTWLSVVCHFTSSQKFLRRIKTLYVRKTFKKTVDSGSTPVMREFQ